MKIEDRAEIAFRNLESKLDGDFAVILANDGVRFAVHSNVSPDLCRVIIEEAIAQFTEILLEGMAN